MVFEVKSPILGFEDVSKMRLEKIDDLVMKLSNNENSSPIFTLINPFILRDYDFEIPTALQIILDIEAREDILVGNIMVLDVMLNQDGKEQITGNSTINFLAPVIFNVKNQTMAQVVLDSARYPQYGLSEPLSSYINMDEENQDHVEDVNQSGEQVF